MPVLTLLLRLFALVGFLTLLITVLTGGSLGAPWLLPASGAALALSLLPGEGGRGT